MDEVSVNGSKVKATIGIALPLGALTLLGSLMLVVQKDAAVALDIARQHGQEFNILRAEIALLKQDMRERTQNRYTSGDAAKDLRYIERRFTELESKIKEHKDNDE